jgi:environmental stress-induced protein Ves
MRFLRAAVRVAAPWKNGGGTTFEVASFPAGSTLDSFGWRISLAGVREGGPFSIFPGVDRKLAIIEGRLSLAVEGRDTLELSPDSSVVGFPGDVPTASQPLSSSVTDLNVMTRRGQFSSDMTRYEGGAHQALTRTDSEVTVVIALQPLDLQVAGSRFELGSRDAVLLSRGDSRSMELHPGTHRDGYFVIRIFASNLSASARKNYQE